jgi:glycerol-3-phosphate dehydrogenase (NAD(P)+)
MGAQPSTLAGLAGVGDLLATCAGPLSRNYRMGMELAQGKKVEDIQKEIGGVVEGLTTVTAVCELGQRIGIELPIAELVQKLIAGTIAPDKAIMALMARPLSSE